jgi:hypothetical protein
MQPRASTLLRDRWLGLCPRQLLLCSILRAEQAHEEGPRNKPPCAKQFEARVSLAIAQCAPKPPSGVQSSLRRHKQAKKAPIFLLLWARDHIIKLRSRICLFALKIPIGTTACTRYGSQTRLEEGHKVPSHPRDAEGETWIPGRNLESNSRLRE